MTEKLRQFSASESEPRVSAFCGGTSRKITGFAYEIEDFVGKLAG